MSRFDNTVRADCLSESGFCCPGYSGGKLACYQRAKFARVKEGENLSKSPIQRIDIMIMRIFSDL